MTDAPDDVLKKMDALLRKHARGEAEIPVLTDLVEQPRVDLDAIPVLTDEIPRQESSAPPRIELDLVPEPVIVPVPPEPESVLSQIQAVEAEVQAEIDARIARHQAAPSSPSIEIPLDAPYLPLPEQTVPATPSRDSLTEDSVRQIAALIEDDIARIVKENLRQTLAEELSGQLTAALDKALSSLLEQFAVNMEEVVRASIADELKKQLAPFKRPATPKP